MKCSKCNGRIITNPGEHPQCVVCGWINYSIEPRIHEIKPPPEFSTSRVVLQAIPTDEKIHRKDIVVFISSNAPDDDAKNSNIRYIPTCPYCNDGMKRRAYKAIGDKPSKDKPDLRIRVISYGCDKRHRINLHDCPVNGLLYWSPSGEWRERKKRTSNNRVATPS